MRNLTFAERDGRPLRLDILRSRTQPPTKAPVLLEVHGGAWVIGRKEDQALPLMHLLARRGWVCVSIDYRLSPKATFPDHIVDVKEAIAWVKTNVAQYGGDPSRLVITGGSAGGHLATLASLTPGLDQPGFEDADTTVAGCASMYGVYDFTDRKGHWRGRRLDELLEVRVMKIAMADARDRYEAASPMSVATDAAPPFLVVQGTGDTIVPPVEARVFAEVLAGRQSPAGDVARGAPRAARLRPLRLPAHPRRPAARAWRSAKPSSPSSPAQPARRNVWR